MIRLRWFHVMCLFGINGAEAIMLCQEYGFDPGERMGRDEVKVKALGKLREQVSWIVEHAGSRSSRGSRRKYRWAFIMELFGLGSTSAVELCREHGFNPGEVMGQELDCEEGCHCECHID